MSRSLQKAINDLKKFVEPERKRASDSAKANDFATGKSIERIRAAEYDRLIDAYLCQLKSKRKKERK